MPANADRYTAQESQLLSQLGGSPNGLTTAAAEEIRTKTGTNTVAVGGRHSVLLDLLHCCRNPLVVQLLIIAVVSYFMGDVRSTVVVRRTLEGCPQLGSYH